MAFIDGEHLVFGYQAMIRQARFPVLPLSARLPDCHKISRHSR
jgi:hypothetical protein